MVCYTIPIIIYGLYMYIIIYGYNNNNSNNNNSNNNNSNNNNNNSNTNNTLIIRKWFVIPTYIVPFPWSQEVLLAAVAVGVGATFSAPVGGVLCHGNGTGGRFFAVEMVEKPGKHLEKHGIIEVKQLQT